MDVSFEAKELIPGERWAIYIMWDDEEIGFGNIYFFNDHGRITMDTECMSKDFVKRVLNKLVDISEIIE